MVEPAEVKNGAPRGSGALWNDNADNPGKWPLVKADNPVGEWNTFRIRMIGSSPDAAPASIPRGITTAATSRGGAR